MMRFTMSYRGAMVSNIWRTACTFSSPSGSCSVSQLRSAIAQRLVG
jgi:hypothetical protein